MAALFASMAVKRALDNLSSLLPAAMTSTPSATAVVSQGIEDLRMLEPIMSTIHATLDEAEQHWSLHEESEKLRLKELKDLAYDAEDVVEEYEYEVNRRTAQAIEQPADVEGGASDCSSSIKRRRQEVYEEHGTVAVPSEIAHSARKVRERFTEIKEYSDSFSLSENDGERKMVPDIHSMRQTSSIVFAPRILGREDDKENVIKKLIYRSGEGSCCGSHMSVLAILGMGGLGKTTLAQLVYNDARVRQYFDLCAWVCVSENFNVDIITRKIITSLTHNTCHHIQSGDLQGALVDQVKEKKVFLVLDDVWNERSDYWELLCMPMLASSRCDIIVTTRSKAVASLVQTIPFYNLNCLSPDESWLLFQQTAFVVQEISTPPDLVEIGKSITEKCNGLPLAIKTLGSILRFESDENKWRDVLQSELWDLKQSKNEVLPALELSYKCMPMQLKRCFVSLSLFSKRIYLDEYRVVWLWKLLDLLQCDGSDDKDEIGHLYFNQLFQRSLLQNYIDRPRVVMHDLVHDLACFLAGEDFFRLEGDKSIEIPQGARYMSILSNEKSIEISNASQSLRVITMMGNGDIENPEVLFLNCKKFRIVDIYPGRLANALLDAMGDMRLLRHFSHIVPVELPNSVLNLFNLQILYTDKPMAQGFGRLINLHTVPKIQLCKCGCFFNIRELKNMNKIRKLRMSGLCIASISDANEARLHSKRNLEVLELDFNGWKSCSEHTERSYGNEDTVSISGAQILETLRPHHQSLEVLRLNNFNFDTYPSWLGSTLFSNLTELHLDKCQSQHCPTLGELPSLRSLKIWGMEYVEHIGPEFCSLDRSTKGFLSLVLLCFDGLCRLQEWSGVEDGEFPCLETLRISGSFELRSLPLVPFSSLRSFTLSQSRNIITFPASSTLREVGISSCGSLNELPALPSLQSLQLSDCPSLVTFGHFPLLTVLDLDGQIIEDILHRLVNSHLLLECLKIWSHSLVSIHLDSKRLTSLAQLELRCPNLQYCDELGSLTSLKVLYVSGSPQLHVPDSLRSQLEKLIDL
ncbi:putative disease resistance RPP13-like protein 1 isoform X1 [Panicum virgatum]|uniref:Uncharacterized protein n=1 Tax=Panicum virgatum TaxID=38727 RepID=A0A8T0PY03_PANVG|nr:putative disease resistance RPP13-like protein 1 isoform X1 [Panicum virgatum]XP_039819941.1 putative disease resistance RPP13-like protein 1 isoform X1 [Panicum virgatum]KAG2565995.1 hypothetical protein PVAP13_7NG157700 [Panicum virgatum]